MGYLNKLACCFKSQVEENEVKSVPVKYNELVVPAKPCAVCAEEDKTIAFMFRYMVVQNPIARVIAERAARKELRKD